MAAIPYLWYWIIGGLVAALVATIAIFSEINTSSLERSQITSSENVTSEKIDKDQSLAEQQSVTKSNANENDSKIGDSVENNEIAALKEDTEEKINSFPPTLDTARVDEDGTTLVAGKADPGSILEVMVNEKVKETITVGQDGNFAVLFDLELSDQPQVISVRSIEGGKILVADETMIVAPKTVEIAQAQSVEQETSNESVGSSNFNDAGDQSQKSTESISQGGSESSLSSGTGKSMATQEADSTDKSLENNTTQIGSASKTPQLPQPSEEVIVEDVKKVLTKEPSDSELVSSTSGSEQPTVLLADDEGVKVVQGSVGPNVMTDVLFDTINYSKDGGVAVTGRGSPEAIVRFYLDNAPVASTSVDQEGYWSADLSDVKAGIYTLRLDQLDRSGKVSSRIESPFKRENRDLLAGQIKDIASPARINVITVQPGNTLWAISRERYGRGILYVQVFDANKDKIRDPDLIYPGQIFDLPDDIKVN